MSETQTTAMAAVGYAILSLCMFGDLLLQPDRVASAAWTSEIRAHFLHARAFGFGELARGNLPLWNPHILCGAPYAANFQAALFYPPNWVFLLLPTPSAINSSIALHCFLLGLFMYIWMRGRQLHPLASFVGGAVLMFSVPYFAFIYAGNLSNLCTMAWTPLILRAVDGLLSGAKVRWGLFGAGAVAMQILAGHPQYVYYTALAGGLLWLLSLHRSRERWLVLTTFFLMYFGGAALAAIQLLPGLEANQQSVRGEGVPYEFAAQLSLPPENLLTLVAPTFFGEIHQDSFWGKGVFWELNAFFGVTGLSLAFYGIASGTRESGRFVLAALALIMLILALGANTPLHWSLYHWLPGFGSFRASAKFLFPAILFLIALMSIGFDALLSRVRRAPIFGGALFAFAVALWIAGTLIARSADAGTGSTWQESYLALRFPGRDQSVPDREPTSIYEAPKFIRQSGVTAGASLQRAAFMFAIVALLLWACHWNQRFVYAVMVLAVVEVMFFASTIRASFDVKEELTHQLEALLATQSRDVRVIDEINPNQSMSIGAHNVFGSDPNVPRRFAELFFYAARTPLTEVTQYVKFDPQPAIPSIYRLARSHFQVGTIAQSGTWTYQLIPLASPLPRLVLLSEFQVATTREAALRSMSSDSFDPLKTVILESAPQPVPDSSGGKTTQPAGHAQIVDESTDHLTIRADLQTPAILLITDAYDADWRVTSQDSSASQQYQILPADWAFRAIPLVAGHHLIRLEYAPSSLKLGAIVTAVAICLWTFLVFQMLRHNPTHLTSPAAQS